VKKGLRHLFGKGDQDKRVIDRYGPLKLVPPTSVQKRRRVAQRPGTDDRKLASLDAVILHTYFGTYILLMSTATTMLSSRTLLT
jgi:hypothetical protein